MIQKSNIPKKIAVVALVLTIIAFISSIPFYMFFYDLAYIRSYIDVFYRETVALARDFLISLIFPVSLYLISKDNSRINAMLLLSALIIVLPTQILGNVINTVIDSADLEKNIFTDSIIGSHIITGVTGLIKKLDGPEKNMIPRFLSSLGTIVSSCAYFLKNVLCLFGFVIFLKKRNED